MNFNKLKRKYFFWMEKLQISRLERISVSLLLALIAGVLMLNFYLSRTYNYSQQEYDKITAEFERRSALLKQQEIERNQKYNTEPVVEEGNLSHYQQAEAVPASKPVAVSDKININTANLVQLQSLNGIGETYAKRIIQYREKQGGFESLDELINVKGIGEKRLEKIRPFIKLD